MNQTIQKNQQRGPQLIEPFDPKIQEQNQTHGKKFKRHKEGQQMGWQDGIVYQKKSQESMQEQIEPGRRLNFLSPPFYPNLIEIAVKLEKNFTKEEIITLYLNVVPFGNNISGDWEINTSADNDRCSVIKNGHGNYCCSVRMRIMAMNDIEIFILAKFCNMVCQSNIQ